MTIPTNEVHTDEDLLDFLADVSDATGDLPVITDDPIDVARKYYRPVLAYDSPPRK